MPRLTTVTVVALDKQGEELARAENVLNVGRERFFLRLQPMSAADVNGSRLKVSVTLNTPSDAPLESLEIFWNDRLLTTLFQEPFEAWVEIGAAAGDFRALHKMWGHGGIGKKRKLQLFHALVGSKLEYCLSTLWLVTAQLRRIDGFHARCLRCILGIPASFVSRVSNRSVFLQAGVAPMFEQVKL